MNAFNNKRDLSGVYQDAGFVKHDFYRDFGFPNHLEFKDYYRRYCRNGIAFGVVQETVNKTWEDNPVFKIDIDLEKLSKKEEDVQRHLKKIRFWQCVAEADRRSLVGSYSALIFRFADGKKMSEPVESVPGGIEGLVEAIPAWEEQLQVTSFETDQDSENYGKPTAYHFNESGLKSNKTQPRLFTVHPDRVVIFSKSGTVHDVSPMSAGYNDLITIEKVIGAGGEGFWKTAKNALILEMDKDTQLQQLASAMGVKPEEIADLIEDNVENYNKGFDTSLVTQGITAKSMPVTLPQPEQFFSVALQSFAASWRIPMKVIVGMITGERASTEDNKGWAATCMSRRNNQIIPTLESVADKLVEYKILSASDWGVKWSDLTESSMSDKIERAEKMTAINSTHVDSGGQDLIFTEDEIRDAVDKAPLGEQEPIEVDKDAEDDE